MEPKVSSETSEIRTQTPGNYPKRNKLRIEFVLRSSVTAATLAAPICTDRTFSQSISVDSSLKAPKQVG